MNIRKLSTYWSKWIDSEKQVLSDYIFDETDLNEIHNFMYRVVANDRINAFQSVAAHKPSAPIIIRKDLLGLLWVRSVLHKSKLCENFILKIVTGKIEKIPDELGYVLVDKILVYVDYSD